MLTISPAVTVNQVPGDFESTFNDYILYPDSDDKNVFYAMAEKPTFLKDGEGTPSFNLTWFFGADITGGICSMTVGLPMPNMLVPEVRRKLLDAITGDQSTSNIAKKTMELCVAMDASDAASVAKATALKAELGLNAAAADQKKAVWNKNGDWTQFLPDTNIQIRPIPYTSGTVLVQAFNTKESYAASDPAFSSGLLKTTPSLFNSNAAVVTFNLTEVGASLFWQALGGWELDDSSPKPAGYDKTKGGSSVISVTYQVTFDGMLPEAQATVTLKHDVIAKLDIETQVKNGSWGRTYREDVVRGKEYNDAVDSCTKIVLPAVASKDDKDSVQKLLTDWAGKQLEDMLKAKLPDVSLNDLSLDGARQINQQMDQHRDFTLTQAVSVPKNPQGQLPKLDGLVKGDTRQLFQVINLNDVPYVKVDLAVAAPNVADLKKRMVDRFVVTELTYAGQKLRDETGTDVSSIEYQTSAQQPVSIRCKGTFGKTSKDTQVRYSYLVAYSDGTPSYKASAASQSGNNYLDFSGIDIGVLSVKLNAIDLPWDVISSAHVVLTYGDWKKTVALSRDQTPALISQAFGQAMNQQLSYQLTLNLTAGASVVGDVTPVALKNGQGEITFTSPLGDMVNPISFQLDTDVLKAQLRVEYTFRNSGPDRVFSQAIQLDSARDGGQMEWKVPADSGKACALRIVKARVTTSTGSRELTDLSGGKIDPVEQQLSITVYSDRIDSF
ncbi:hypothetical protein F2P45_29695 [Massilia sp. CCM 8733]|uniref:Uncharacterized protein n=1 Tax=Massilia mucilaginosa TaxID=2609282 RepID=A0ABX0P1H3_9BURK|nr:hypothetical protein [Massilia mucilaginosa]NHZ93153.1 hypothetical protein [Massilia mucilaginosa]